MKYRNLGKCGAKVSVISLGSWLTIGGTVDNKRSGNLIKLGFEKGINFFDTADVYNYGMAEITLGKSLKDFRRQDLFIASKCFGKMSDEPNDKGLSRKHIFESVHKSLKNLKTDYIDLYQCHRYDPDTTLGETCRAFNTLIEQGKILYWGVSEWSKDEIKNALEICEKYNLHKPVKYNKKKIENDSRLKDKKNNTFVKNFVNDENLNKVGELIKLSEKTGISVSNLALAWCLRDETVSSAITSATKESQLKENIKASETELTEEILTEIEKIFKSAK